MNNYLSKSLVEIRLNLEKFYNHTELHNAKLEVRCVVMIFLPYTVLDLLTSEKGGISISGCYLGFMVEWGVRRIFGILEIGK